MKNRFSPLTKTLVLAAGLSLGGGVLSYTVQAKANQLVPACTYLDPITIDILALGVSLFLFIEGLIAIFKHKESKVITQLTRCMRMSIGTGIFVIHILQTLHK